MPSVNTRVFFSKMGRAKYISALDLGNCVSRAIRRSGLPVWKTEGFNSRTYVAFMLPLPLGQEGEREAMDFRLLRDISFEEVRDRLNGAFPPDIRAVEVSVPKRKNTDIASADYRIEIGADAERLIEFAGGDSIVVEKKTKKGVTELDLKPLISELRAEGNAVCLRLPAGNEFNINPALLLGAFTERTGEDPGRLRIVRTRILCADGSEFE